MLSPTFALLLSFLLQDEAARPSSDAAPPPPSPSPSPPSAGAPREPGDATPAEDGVQADREESPARRPRSSLRDPTCPDGAFRAARPAPAESGATGLARRPEPIVLPPLTLRGLIVATGRPGAAAIAVGDELFHISRGQTFAVTATSGARVTLVIAELKSDEVRIEAPDLGASWTLR